MNDELTTQQIGEEIRRYAGTHGELIKASNTLAYKELVEETVSLFSGVMKTSYQNTIKKVSEKEPTKSDVVNKISALMIMTRALTVISDNLEADRILLHMIHSGYLKTETKPEP